MYSDCFFNFSQIFQNEGIDDASQILNDWAKSKPYFALDCGIRADDIFLRVENLENCLENLESEDDKKNLKKAFHFCAGIMMDYDSVMNRFDYVEELEKTISDFNSSDEFQNKIVALGPSGIDHDWNSVEFSGRDHDFFDSQTIEDECDLFALQLTLAKKLNMPFVLHSRQGFKNTMDVLKAVKWNKGFIHGFSYSKSELEFFLDLGWYVSFNGSVTFSGKKNADEISEIINFVPKDRLLIETDSPYYAPVPVKNSKNNPNNLNYIYEFIGAKRNLSSNKLSEIVDSNCKKLFDL